jgi:hypothetical protein
LGNIDEVAAVWLDLNQNGSFELSELIGVRSAAGAFGPFSTPALIGGETYTLAFAMNDGTAGSAFPNLQFRAPSGVFANINPSDPGQNGLWTVTVEAESVIKNNTGKLTIAGNLTVGGTLSPGSPPAGIGALTGSGSVTLQNGATTRLGVTGLTSFVEIIGTGAAFTNDGALVLSIDSSGTFANGTTFGLIHGFATPHLGSFDTAHMLATGAYAGLDNTAMSNATFYGPDVWVSDWVNSDGNGQNGQRFRFNQTTARSISCPSRAPGRSRPSPRA